MRLIAFMVRRRRASRLVSPSRIAARVRQEAVR